MLIRTCPDATPQERRRLFREAHPTRLTDLGFLGASVGLSGPLLSQSCISGGLNDTRTHDRLNLSRLGLGDTLNLTSFILLGVTPPASMTCPVSVRHHLEGYPVRGAVGQVGASPRHRGRPQPTTCGSLDLS